MSAQICPVCDAWVLLPRVSDRSIGLRPLRWPHHTRGKVRNAPACPQSGGLLRVWALSEQREGA